MSSGDGDTSGGVVPPETASSSGEAPAETSTGAESEGSSSTGPLELSCPYGELLAPETIATSTLDQDSEFTTSCGGGGAPDVSYTLEAPEDGFYVMRASSPDGVVDPLLAIFGGACGGSEIACNHDVGSGTDAELGVQLAAGEVVTVVVDGFALAGGAVDLSVTYFAGTCPDGDLGATVPVHLSGDTSPGDNTVFGSCGGDTAFDDTHTFTAPTDGVYAIDTAGSDFDTILYVREGCDGAELGCNDNVGSQTSSHLNLNLAAGQEIIVAVDGAEAESGAYQINIDRDTCPDVTLPSVVPQLVEGSTVGELDASTGSCGGGGAPGLSYAFVAPEPGIYTIDSTGSDFDTVLYALDACGGAELSCNDDAGGVGGSSRIHATLAAEETLLFVVDGADGQEGAVELNIELDSCPDFDLGTLAPQTVTGNTEAQIDASDPPCGFATSAPDVAYTFTAPATGTYVFDTNGSDFNTILYVLDGETCGTETSLDCDDNSGDGLDSLLSLGLTEGQTVTVVVDGSGSASGEYQLNIAAPECGNGVVEFGEDCDGENLDGQTCFSIDDSGGVLGCNDDCTADLSGCGLDCGNAELDAGEVCDLTELGQARCEDFGFAGGSLDCAADCTIDTNACADDNLVVVCSTPGSDINSSFPITTDTINIAEMGEIVDVDVFVGITHTFGGDLEMTLLADTLGLQNDLAFDDCGGQDDVWAFFNDEATIGTGTACVAPIGLEGNLVPDAPLSIYDGAEVNGSWTLSVTDDAGGDSGTLDEWCLYVTLAP